MNAVRRITICIAFALASCAASELPAADPTPPAWELWPYRVHLLTAVERSGQTPPKFEEELTPWLQAKAAATVGGMWRLDVSPATAELRQKLLAKVESLTTDDISTQTKGADKLILVGVSSTAGGWQIRAREFDIVTSLWNSTISRDVRQSPLLGHETFRAVMDAFAPQARIENADGSSVTLRLRASALAPDGRVPLADGTVFRPVLVPGDAQGAVVAGKAELIDWTYLAPSEHAGSQVQCRLLTALRGTVVPEYHPQRQRWAVAVAPSSQATRLRLITRGSNAEPIEGCDVVAVESSAGEGAKEVPLGRSDRRGEVAVSPGSQTIRQIEVRHGDEVLARVPIATGLDGEITLAVDFDAKRLPLEAALVQLADDLIDLAARREVLAARIRTAEQTGKPNDVATLREQLRQVGSVDTLLARLDKLQQQLQSASPRTQKRLQEKLAGLRKAIDQLQAPAATTK